MLTFYRLISFYNSLPSDDTYRPAVSRIMNNLRLIPGFTVDELAKLCYISPTTINRLVRRIGCQNYSEFKHDIKEALQAFDLQIHNMSNSGTSFISTPRDTLVQLSRASLELADSISEPYLDEISLAIKNSRCIHYYADIRDCFTSQNVRLLQLHLIMSGLDTNFLYDPQSCIEAARTLREDCFVIIPCAKYLPSYKHAISLMQQARSNGAKVLAITERGTPNAAENADYLLEYRQEGECIDFYLVDWLILSLTQRYACLGGGAC